MTGRSSICPGSKFDYLEARVVQFIGLIYIFKWRKTTFDIIIQLISFLSTFILSRTLVLVFRLFSFPSAQDLNRSNWYQDLFFNWHFSLLLFIIHDACLFNYNYVFPNYQWVVLFLGTSGFMYAYEELIKWLFALLICLILAIELFLLICKFGQLCLKLLHCKIIYGEEGFCIGS